MKHKNPLQKRIQTEAIKSLLNNFLGTEHFSWIALSIAVFFSLLAGWIPDGISNLLLPHGDRMQGVCQLALSVSMLLLIGAYLRKKIEKKEKIRVEDEDSRPAKILLLLLSRIRPKERVKDLTDRISDGVTLTMDDVVGIPWEMPLIAIDYHKSCLEEVVVVTSDGEDGSHEQFEGFRKILDSIFPEKCFKTQELTAPNLDFESLLDVHDLLDRWYEKKKERADLGPHDLVVDLTGGQKPASIAAALVTLSEGRRFQYISTNDTSKVKTYDLVVIG